MRYYQHMLTAMYILYTALQDAHVMYRGGGHMVVMWWSCGGLDEVLEIKILESSSYTMDTSHVLAALTIHSPVIEYRVTAAGYCTLTVL